MTLITTIGALLLCAAANEYALTCKTRTWYMNGYVQECWPTDDPEYVECQDFNSKEMLDHICEQWGEGTNFHDFAILAKHWNP